MLRLKEEVGRGGELGRAGSSTSDDDEDDSTVFFLSRFEFCDDFLSDVALNYEGNIVRFFFFFYLATIFPRGVKSKSR